MKVFPSDVGNAMWLLNVLLIRKNQSDHPSGQVFLMSIILLRNPPLFRSKLLGLLLLMVWGILFRMFQISLFFRQSLLILLFWLLSLSRLLSLDLLILLDLLSRMLLIWVHPNWSLLGRLLYLVIPRHWSTKWFPLFL